jgi:hypothetical protein
MCTILSPIFCNIPGSGANFRGKFYVSRNFRLSLNIRPSDRHANRTDNNEFCFQFVESLPFRLSRRVRTSFTTRLKKSSLRPKKRPLLKLLWPPRRKRRRKRKRERRRFTTDSEGQLEGTGTE